MENIKNLIKENIKKINKTVEEGKKLNVKLNENNCKLFYEDRKTYEEIEEKYKLNGYEIKLYKNNLKYLLQEIFLKDKGLKEIYIKYHNKKIGDKTKEKIKEEITTYLKEKYNINTYFYLHFDYDYSGILYRVDYEIDLLLSDDNYWNRIELKISNYFNDDIEGYSEEELEELKIYNWNFVEIEGKYRKLSINEKIYEYIENVKQKAKKIYNQKKQGIEKINKHIEEINKLYKEYNKDFSGYLLNDEICKNDLKYISIY